MAAKKETSKAVKEKAPKSTKSAKAAAAKSGASKTDKPAAAGKTKKAAKGDEPSETSKAKAPSKAAKSKSSSKDSNAKARLYQPHEIYTVGELIKHPVWGEEGTITELTETPDGVTFIIVDFGDRGTKRLVVDYSLKL